MENANLLAAVAAIRSLGIVVVKTARNTGLNSDYATYADVWAHLKEPLAANGLSVGFLPGNTTNTGSAWSQDLILQVIWRETGKDQLAVEFIAVPFQVLFPEGNRGVNLTQRQGMAHTYGKRYALIDFFGLITGDDDDAQRLGQTPLQDQAPRPDKYAHWRQYCHVPVFSLDNVEAQGSWGMLNDPSDPEGQRVLGDCSPQAIAKAFRVAPDHPGISAWRAELIQARADAKGIRSWEECCELYPRLKLPAQFVDCNPDQLANLALELNNK